MRYQQAIQVKFRPMWRLLFCLLLVGALPAAAQTGTAERKSTPGAQSPSLHIGSVDVSGELSVRGQGWNWFQDNKRVIYGFGQSTLRVALSQKRQRFDWRLEMEQPTLFALPNDAVPAGQMNPFGLGGSYYAANNGRENTASAFLKQAYINFSPFGGGKSRLKLGRFEFNDGGEVTPTDRTLAWVKNDRLNGRLIGSADWYGIGRSFDGANFVYSLAKKTTLGVMAARPTRGVFDVNGNGELEVDVQYVDLTQELPAKHSTSELRFFAMNYHDGRRTLKVDNRTLAEREADTANIRIGTFGASYVMVFGTPIGKWDLSGWGAWQTGRWGLLSQGADAVTAEVGWQPPVLKFLHPYLRAAANYGSGDSNPSDNKHETFFQPLPSQTQYAMFPYYTMQNGQDYFATLLLRPSPRATIQFDVHKTKLSEPQDLWYQGTGAFQNTSFGYTGQATRNQGSLANYIDCGIDALLVKGVWLKAYIGALSGKSTLSTLQHGQKGGFAYTELIYKF